MTGRVVRTLVNTEKEAGYYNARLEAEDLAFGIYFTKFVAGNYKSTKKLILVRQSLNKNHPCH